MTQGGCLVVEKGETVAVRSSDDVVRVRQAVRARALEAGFGIVDQTKLVTAASEIARNTVDYGGGGTTSAFQGYGFALEIDVFFVGASSDEDSVAIGGRIDGGLNRGVVAGNVNRRGRSKRKNRRR